jgi:hypothetical protein
MNSATMPAPMDFAGTEADFWFSLALCVLCVLAILGAAWVWGLEQRKGHR